MSTDASEVFEQHRRLLAGVAYRVLGRVAESEDVVQEAWLRWTSADRSQVVEPRAYLLKVVTRLAIDQLRHETAQRESYVGPWLPEPLLTVPDASDRAELIESISIAMLVVLEALSPLERAVFVLHEAFGIPHTEIAVILDRNEPAVRQLARRARAHVREARPRFDTDPVAHVQVTETFVRACESGDLDTLLAVLAPDVVIIGDGGGIGRAPRKPIEGAERVAKFLLGLNKVAIPDISVEIVTLNAAPGIVIRSGGEPLSVFVLDLVDGRVQTVCAIANPQKLKGLAPPRSRP